MPTLNRKQFWKANPNQMALPGMEDLSHPGAVALSQGYRFVRKGNSDRAQVAAHLSTDYPGEDTRPPHRRQDSVAQLTWAKSNEAYTMDADLNKGEIEQVYTDEEHSRKGLASALYGIGRTMARVKPQHSWNRTPDGDVWAQSVSKKYGGRIPQPDRYKY